MEAPEKKVEAVLFTAGRELSAERIASLCSLEAEEVEKIIKNLMELYRQRESSLQIVIKDEGWKLTVKDEFVPLVSNLAASTEMEKPLMETLAVIAWKYPVVQSEVIKLRHATAYEHMKELEKRGFIEKVRFGRTYQVKLTKKFFEYFDLPSEEAKKAFIDKVPAEVLLEAEQVDKEADEVERLVELEQKEEKSRAEIKDALKSMHGE